ncbi:MAG: cytochrome b [Thiogranum sp.]|nr:cytochrome b [Thiogranum sp.]
MWCNTDDSYGRISISLHWLIAVAVIGLFALGLWMVELDYYDPWYQRAPELHKSAGVLLFGLVLLRLVWHYSNPRPRPVGSRWESRAATLAHASLNLLLLATLVSGYLISTADGRPIDVFGLFQVPATLAGLQNQADLAGKIHELLSFILIGLAGLHALAALKHHFINHDATLRRMLASRQEPVD